MIILQTIRTNREKHPVLLLILLCGILASVALPVHPGVPLLPCLFKSIFHVPCPGCGMTRAFILLGHFRLPEALMMNAGSVFAYALFILLTINEMLLWLTGRQIRIKPSRSFAIVVIAVSFCIMAVMWYSNLSRAGVV